MTHATRTEQETRNTREHDLPNQAIKGTRRDSDKETQNNRENPRERNKVNVDPYADTKPFFITDKDRAQWRHDYMKVESRRRFA